MFFKKKEGFKNLEDVLKKFDEVEKEIEKISKNLENLKKESKLCIHKIAIVRYNPFSNVGGDQSFSIALLDDYNNGMVITSLYAENGNRVYGKKVENGKSEYTLSEEEQKAINQAMQQK